MANRATHGYLTDDQGDPSSMRLMSMISLIAAIVFGLITVLQRDVNHENGLYITGLFVLGAFAPKALQKFAEARFSSLGSTADGRKPSSGRADVHAA